MSAEVFQLIDDSKIDDCFIKRDFTKRYHQHGAEVNNENQNFIFCFSENLKCLQIGNGYLEFDLEVKKTDNTKFFDADETRLVENGLTYIIQEGRLSTSSGTEIQNNKYLGRVSTLMTLLTQKDGDLSPYFDESDETEGGFTSSLLKHMLIDTHSNENNRGKIITNLPVERIFGFCKTFKKISEGFGFQLQLETSNEKRKDIYTNPGDNDVIVTINSLYLYLPSLVRSSEQQPIFSESIRQSFTLLFESWAIDRKPVFTSNHYHLDIGSASNINVLLYPVAAHQKTQRDKPAKPPIQFNNVVYDNVNV